MTPDKTALRRSARQLRDQLKTMHPDASSVVRDRFPLKLLERYGPCVAGYVAIGSEFDPSPLLDRLRRLGAKVCYPRVESDTQMTFRMPDPETGLVDGPFGLSQPDASAQIVTPTLILTPMLAFDAAGNRLGYGKGHYDRAIANLRTTGRAFICGLAYSGQEVLKIPAESTDIPLDWVVTENGSIPLFLGRTRG